MSPKESQRTGYMSQNDENRGFREKIWALNCPIVYGPVPSRRLGYSLGINLLPDDKKHCNFDCLYCQCGWTRREMLNWDSTRIGFPALRDLDRALREEFQRLHEGNIFPDTIVFSGNGEPTLHPQFDQAVEIARTARDSYLPDSLLGILTNGTVLATESTFQAVASLDLICLKLDAGNLWMDRPCTPYQVDELLPIWRRVPGLVIQSFFCEGRFANSGEEWLGIWIKQIQEIQPSKIQIYTLDRKPPVPSIEKARPETLERIAHRVRVETGLDVQVF
jgi:wyosine [tRNA(Phe)-imidazoG37] synthetase (radical SAM superfamily)